MRQEHLARAAVDYAVRLAIEARQLQAEELQEIDHAVHEKVSLPANYWHARYHAEMRARAARALAEALIQKE